jgi:uncharacterized protein
MKIWVDADSCPAVIKDILFRAVKRTGLQMTLVANHPMRIPVADNIKFKIVKSGIDIADNEISSNLKSGDLVITADIPLAAEVIEKGAQALNPRGELYTTENVRARLSMRDFMENLRSQGVETGGPASISQADRKIFADNLDRILTTYKQKKR